MICLGAVLCPLSVFPQSTEQLNACHSLCIAVLCVRPHRGHAAYARNRSHRGFTQLLSVTATCCLEVSGCRLAPLLFSTDLIEVPTEAFTAVCSLELSLAFTSMLCAWCFQFCTTSTLTFGRFSEVGLLAIFDRRLCRHALQASVPVLEMVRRNGYRAGLSQSPPFTPQPSTWRPVRARSCA